MFHQDVLVSCETFPPKILIFFVSAPIEELDQRHSSAKSFPQSIQTEQNIYSLYSQGVANLLNLHHKVIHVFFFDYLGSFLHSIYVINTLSPSVCVSVCVSVYVFISFPPLTLNISIFCYCISGE